MEDTGETNGDARRAVSCRLPAVCSTGLILISITHTGGMLFDVLQYLCTLYNSASNYNKHIIPNYLNTRFFLLNHKILMCVLLMEY